MFQPQTNNAAVIWGGSINQQLHNGLSHFCNEKTFPKSVLSQGCNNNNKFAHASVLITRSPYNAF